MNKPPKPNQNKPKKAQEKKIIIKKNATTIHLTKTTNLHKPPNTHKALKRRTPNPIHNPHNTTHRPQDKNVKNQTLKTNKNHLKQARPTGLAQKKITKKNRLYSKSIHTKNPNKPITKQTNTATDIQNNNKRTQKITTDIPNKHKNNSKRKIKLHTSTQK